MTPVTRRLHGSQTGTKSSSSLWSQTWFSAARPEPLHLYICPNLSHPSVTMSAEDVGGGDVGFRDRGGHRFGGDGGNAWRRPGGGAASDRSGARRKWR